MTTYHPALNGLGNIARKHHTLLTGSEEHKEVFPVPPVVAFRRCKNLKDILVRARLTSGREDVKCVKSCLTAIVLCLALQVKNIRSTIRLTVTRPMLCT